MAPFAAQLSVNLSSQSGSNGGFVFLLFAAGFLVWLFTLIGLLKRQDLKDAEKLIWTVVLCTLNVVGLLLYWFMAPAEKNPPRPRSDKELKEHFNRRAEQPE